MKKVTKIEAHIHAADRSVTYYCGTTFDEFWAAEKGGAGYYRHDEDKRTYLALMSDFASEDEFLAVVGAAKDDNNGEWSFAEQKDNGKYSLVGVDGNAYSIMGTLQKWMRREGFSKAEIDAYMENAKSGDYNHLLAVSIAMVQKLNEKAHEDE